MGLNIISSAIDYMLETISLVTYLLFSPYYSINFNYLINILDASVSFNLLLNSEINNYAAIKIINTDIQSAENCLGFSGTIRHLFNSALTPTQAVFPPLQGKALPPEPPLHISCA